MVVLRPPTSNRFPVALDSLSQLATSSRQLADFLVDSPSRFLSLLDSTSIRLSRSFVRVSSVRLTTESCLLSNHTSKHPTPRPRRTAIICKQCCLGWSWNQRHISTRRLASPESRQQFCPVNKDSTKVRSSRQVPWPNRRSSALALLGYVAVSHCLAVLHLPSNIILLRQRQAPFSTPHSRTIHVFGLPCLKHINISTRCWVSSPPRRIVSSRIPLRKHIPMHLPLRYNVDHFKI